MDKIRWLLVGAGDISQKRVAPALASASGSEITAICDPRTEQAKALAADCGVQQCYADFDQALEASGADAVYVATPVWLHTEHAVKALGAGKHVIVEKPLGLSEADSLRAVDAAQRSGKKAACAYYRRFYPRYHYTKEMLTNGEFGQVVSVRMTYSSWMNPAPVDPKHWRVVRAKSGGGPLSDMGTHMFDLLIALFGMPRSVYARCENITSDWDVEDSAAVVMRLSNNALVTASFNWNSKTWRHEFEIIGTEAKIDWLPYDSGPVVKTMGRTTESVDLPNADNVHLPVVEDFVQAVIADRQPVCPLSEAAKTNALLDAIYWSANENREISLTSQKRSFANA
ncbi:MAG: Gfo/Idh/MocA family oxidoreductase [Armatimonadetes bacterium]|nr:Gfo/Idh/MocA family oxidoreductase [Armatimonadota bacterium]